MLKQLFMVLALSVADTITLTNPNSGITGQWTGGDLHVQGHCPTFVL